jgi:SAM-dependent methyltransferase
VPPQLFNYVGGSEFPKIGKGYFNYILQFCDLRHNESILDVGCGIGRVAIHFIDYIGSDGRYEGFDVVKKGIDWCNVKIARKHPNFTFRHVNIYNKEYNKRGTINANDFVFPYQNGSFDFSFATSVFTHMLPDAVVHYLEEINRVLDRYGRCLISWFILNAESKKHMRNSQFNFKQMDDRYGVIVEDNPESAIAYEEDFIKEIYNRAKLNIIYPIHYGTWSGRNAEVGGQDIIVAKKRDSIE